jgi:hypothetical protein
MKWSSLQKTELIYSENFMRLAFRTNLNTQGVNLKFI